MTFRVYYIDGNQRLFEADSIIDVINYLVSLNDSVDITKIERI